MVSMYKILEIIAADSIFRIPILKYAPSLIDLTITKIQYTTHDPDQ